MEVNSFTHWKPHQQQDEKYYEIERDRGCLFKWSGKLTKHIIRKRQQKGQL